MYIKKRCAWYCRMPHFMGLCNICCDCKEETEEVAAAAVETEEAEMEAVKKFPSSHTKT